MPQDSPQKRLPAEKLELNHDDALLANLGYKQGNAANPPDNEYLEYPENNRAQKSLHPNRSLRSSVWNHRIAAFHRVGLPEPKTVGTQNKHARIADWY